MEDKDVLWQALDEILNVCSKTIGPLRRAHLLLEEVEMNGGKEKINDILLKITGEAGLIGSIGNKIRLIADTKRVELGGNVKR
ncbi:MAG: hypothetical protein HQ537_02675 [Parcubacteria group bacterium]|nr:hypothetical protein [Parcubacteria group bacterium]